MIHVNDREAVKWEEGMTVSDLLERLGYTFRPVIVKVDEEMVPRGEYSRRTVPDDAEVRVIHRIAGG